MNEKQTMLNQCDETNIDKSCVEAHNEISDKNEDLTELTSKRIDDKDVVSNIKSSILDDEGKLEPDKIRQLFQHTTSVKDLLNKLVPGVTNDSELQKLLDDNKLLVSAIDAALLSKSKCNSNQVRDSATEDDPHDPVCDLVQDSWLSDLS